MESKESKSGVKIYDNFRSNLIISNYDNQFVGMRSDKIEKIRSANSEDAVTWNYFKSLREINPELWFPKLFSHNFNSECKYSINDICINLWKEISPPPSLTETQKEEGNSEIDTIIESKDFVWFFEAKYKSEISLRTKNNEKRDQLIRNIDVGSHYAGERDFYFSLIYFDEKYSPIGIEKILEYKSIGIDGLKKILVHRHDSLENIKGISCIKWIDILKSEIKVVDFREETIFDTLCDYIENLGIRQ